MFSVLILGRVAYDNSKKQYLQLAVSSLSYWEVELSQLLKQMKFCADELEALQHKQYADILTLPVFFDMAFPILEDCS
jgi:hypothetical protein